MMRTDTMDPKFVDIAASEAKEQFILPDVPDETCQSNENEVNIQHCISIKQEPDENFVTESLTMDYPNANSCQIFTGVEQYDNETIIKHEDSAELKTLEPLVTCSLEDDYVVYVKVPGICEAVTQQNKGSNSVLLCSHCAKRFIIVDSSSSHSLFQREEMPVRCPHCIKLVCFVSELTCDMQIHPLERKHFHCFTCGITCRNLDNFNMHVKEMHLQNMRILNLGLHREICIQHVEANPLAKIKTATEHLPSHKVSPAYYKSKVELYSYSVYGKDRHFECSKCGKKYLNKCSFMQHQVHCVIQPQMPIYSHVTYAKKRELNQRVVRCVESYECQQCGKVFLNRSDLNQHILLHNADKNYQGSQCAEKFCNEDYVEADKQAHVNEKSFECLQCGRKFAQARSLNLHLVVHRGEKSYECTLCRKIFYSEAHLKAHERYYSHSQAKTYLCSLCDKVFFIKSYLDRHKLIHHGVKSYMCSLCDKTFAKLRSFKRHELVHSGERPHECMQCNKRFCSKSELKVHERIHSGVKPYSCSLCDRKFYRKSYLDRHQIQLHSGEQPYGCLQCDKKFSSKRALNRHIVVHTGERRHKCSECGKKFSSSSSLCAHKYTHRAEKRFECSVCGKKYSQRYTLNQHVALHSSERPYKCSVCVKTFAQSSALRDHEQIHFKRDP